MDGHNPETTGRRTEAKQWGLMSIVSGAEAGNNNHEQTIRLRRALDAGWEPFAVAEGQIWLRKWEYADAKSET